MTTARVHGSSDTRGPVLTDRAALDRAAKLAAETFAARADDYDRRAAFPAEDFDDLFAAGLLAAAVPRAYGGLGFGPQQRNTLPLWEMTTTLAAADLSLARCWEGHANALVLIDALGTPEQRRRWFTGVVERGEKWVAWSGEPRAPKPGESNRFGTTVVPVDGGWTLRGTKAFATGATGAEWAILLVDPAGPGGARHARPGRDGRAAGSGLLLLACELSDPTVTVDDSWWDPVGMRATASHLVRFEDTFVPRDNLIGAPGSYFTGHWQTAFVPHYAASFLGAAQAACAYGLEYLRKQDKGADPYVRQRAGSMAVNVDTARLWLRHVAALWDGGSVAEAGLAGSKARHVVEHLAEETVHHCIRACGARSLVRPSPVERILRDLTFYQRHDNDDHILATIGRAVLGEDHDPSFHTP
ncbi:acyl-CoA dehydrogenase [Streptomyces luteolifulvus]|jgi:alkylation response protein AidB-like acyl-CoA dehydrogenase|uniref:Acyl-CoA dehydrogenase n=1 Tax=Streptomyces luteolifulvus TaxID=2615112 RepID=A0A6H9UQ20_9ACTN|nr:acyl-CoA dehydrogenase family protein [Streptomyces luteolifulvus]KAB1140276.1 acyl-CoA dehydrogenase [Streptomyces luteolifulvus]